MKSVDSETIKTTSTMNQTNENWAVIVALKRNSSYFNQPLFSHEICAQIGIKYGIIIQFISANYLNILPNITFVTLDKIFQVQTDVPVRLIMRIYLYLKLFIFITISQTKQILKQKKVIFFSSIIFTQFLDLADLQSSRFVFCLFVLL